jgi:hypothetical protein
VLQGEWVINIPIRVKALQTKGDAYYPMPIPKSYISIIYNVDVFHVRSPRWW